MVHSPVHLVTQVPLRQTLFARISSVLLVLLVSLGIAQFFRVWTGWERSSEYAEQLSNAPIAGELARQFELVLNRAGSFWELQQIAHFALATNPSISIYILDAEGEILADLSESGRAQRSRIAVEPILEFLSGAATVGPIYGDQPDHQTRSTIFSAAPLNLELPAGAANGDLHGIPKYVYVGLRNKVLEMRSRVLGQRFSLRTAIIDTSLYVIAAMLAGLLAYRVLTSRFRRLTHVVGRFAQGDLSQRAPVTGRDEVDVLAATFNSMADAIARSMQDLAHRDELRRELIGSVSHDLRQPLGVLRAHLEQLVPDVARLSELEIRGRLETMLRTERSLEELLNHLFELAKLDARERIPAAIAVPLDELCAEIARRYEPVAAPRRVNVRSESSAEGVLVMVDPEMIERALSNLVENALRFTPAGGSVTLRTSREGAMLRVAVSDTGVGIAADDLPKVFDRHYQAESGRRDPYTAGLGLAIVRRIIELHEGELRVESEEGRGTTFFFELPLGVAGKSGGG